MNKHHVYVILLRNGEPFAKIIAGSFDTFEAAQEYYLVVSKDAHEWATLLGAEDYQLSLAYGTRRSVL